MPTKSSPLDNSLCDSCAQMKELTETAETEVGDRGIDGGDMVMSDSNANNVSPYLSLTAKAKGQVAWAVSDGVIHFKPELYQSSAELSSLEVIKRTLMYARELERIV